MSSVLIIGNGGREHALAYKMAQSSHVSKVFVAPGNAGTALESNVINVDIDPLDVAALIKFAKQEHIALTVVGPEAPLAAGIVDAFQTEKLACFGPCQAAAQLEASKAFSKDFMAKYHIPTAKYQRFTAIEPAKAYVQQHGTPIVVKASGLAAGKGVVIAHTQAQAFDAIDDMLSKHVFGHAGAEIVIEEFLVGEEASFIVMVDGQHILPLATSQDHKARDNGDKGPNTGGMGAYSPAPVVTPALHDKILTTVIQPVVKAMRELGHPYVGFLYAGVMISPNGHINVLEFNCRLGDPETQPIMMRLQSDLYELCTAALKGHLNKTEIKWDPRPALGVVMAAGGYPEQYNKGDIITGLPEQAVTDCKVFHAGTKQIGTQVTTHGGRVLCVTALGDTVTAAQNKAYATVRNINWSNCFYRTDIGYRAC